MAAGECNNCIDAQIRSFSCGSDACGSHRSSHTSAFTFDGITHFSLSLSICVSRHPSSPRLSSMCSTAGHPENILHPGIEVSTGPLGQGISNAVGLAIGEANLAATYNKAGEEPILGNYTYVVCGDGCLQEGISSEASSLAGHLGLGKLIVLYDDNHVTIDGDTELSFTEDVLKRYEAYGWHTSHVAHGDSDVDAIEAAVRAAQAVTDKPSIIKVTTTIGFGSKKAGTEAVHGAPLGKDDIKHAKAAFGFDPEASFVVPEEVAAVYRSAVARGAEAEGAWNARLDAYAAAHAAEAAELRRRLAGELPEGWMDKLPRYKSTDKADATRCVPCVPRHDQLLAKALKLQLLPTGCQQRASIPYAAPAPSSSPSLFLPSPSSSSYPLPCCSNLSGVVLGAMGAAFPELIGGSADLTPSNKTHYKGVVDFQAATPAGRYLRFGVREHAMAAVCNGLAAYGGFMPYCGTFLNFIGYAMGAVRLSALSHFRVLYVATHDSIGLGEDGPTHQPVELLEGLRATPNM